MLSQLPNFHSLRQIKLRVLLSFLILLIENFSDAVPFEDNRKTFY